MWGSFYPMRVKAVEPSSGASERARKGREGGHRLPVFVSTPNVSPSRPQIAKRSLRAKRAQHMGARAFCIELELPTVVVGIYKGKRLSSTAIVIESLLSASTLFKWPLSVSLCPSSLRPRSVNKNNDNKKKQPKWHVAPNHHLILKLRANVKCHRAPFTTSTHLPLPPPSASIAGCLKCTLALPYFIFCFCFL